MSKQHIIETIKELVDSDGNPPGQEKFEKISGLKRTAWYGKYWARWGDALTEAGFAPNKFNNAYSKDVLLQHYLDLVIELEKLPTTGEIRLKGNNFKNFPSHNVFNDSLGNKQKQLKELLNYAKATKAPEIIMELISGGLKTAPIKSTKSTNVATGYVYLIKFGDFFKIGRSNDFNRRLSEIKTQLPEEGELLHVIETDDPEGIEAYWHNRFKDKRARGEWFKLSNDDIKILRKRKFM